MAYLDGDMRDGWSVIVIGLAATVDEPAELDLSEELLHPWLPRR